MGDWTGTVPTILAGDVVSGDDWDNVTDELSAISGAWTTWSPTLTSLTIGNGTQVAQYRRVGKTVDYVFQFILGSTSAVGTNPAFTLPATPAAHYVNSGFQLVPAGEVFILDFGTTSKGGKVTVLTGSTATIKYDDQSTVVAGTITATSPWTWTTSDMLTAYGTYQTT